MDVIHGYTMTQPFSCQDAGTCMWGYCEKDGHGFFIKKFLQPKYPADTNGFSEAILERKKRMCEDFYVQKQRFYTALSRCATGNLVFVRDFFREGSSYYAVSEKMPVGGISPDRVRTLDLNQKMTLLREILFSISRLHAQHIIHADIKPDNFLLKQTKKGYCTAKIIDFDAGFFEDEPPREIQGDPVYLAPETFLAMDGEPVKLTTKLDIFALGILFHQYLTGELPGIPEDNQYIFEAVLDGATLTFSPDLSLELSGMIRRMLSRNPDCRPSASELFAMLAPAVPPEPEPVKPPVSHPKGFYMPSDFD